MAFGLMPASSVPAAQGCQTAVAKSCVVGVVAWRMRSGAQSTRLSMCVVPHDRWDLVRA